LNLIPKRVIDLCSGDEEFVPESKRVKMPAEKNDIRSKGLKISKADKPVKRNKVVKPVLTPRQCVLDENQPFANFYLKSSMS